MSCFKLIIDMLLLYRAEDTHKAMKEVFVATDTAEFIRVTDLPQ